MLPGIIALVEKPYQSLKLPTAFRTQESRLVNGSAVWLEGTTLCVLHRERATYVGITGGIQESMSRIPGTDLWGLRLRMKEWNRAVIQYAFFTPQRRVPSYEEYRVWRGPNAPVVQLAQPLRGRLQHIDFRSAALGESRRITTYEPPFGFAKGPVIFMTDGESTEGLAQALEPLIMAKKVPPYTLVGIYSGDWGGRGHREAEYFGYGDRYARHQRFFSKEVPTWAAKTLGVGKRRKDRTLFGFSRGASYLLTVCEKFPDLASTVIAVAGGNPKQPPAPNTRYVFAAGSLDTSCGASRGTAITFRAPFIQLVGGHDFEIARAAFVLALLRL